MTVVEPVAERRDELEAERTPGCASSPHPSRGCSTTPASGSPGAVLAVKPDVAEGACRALGVDRGDPRCSPSWPACPPCALEAALGGEPAVVRAMPNTAGPGRRRGDRHLGRVLRHVR